MSETNPTITYSPCANNYYQYETTLWTLQTRGVTTWNLNNEYTIPNNALLMPHNQANDSATLIFTNTMPKCYAPPGRDTCNIVFNAWRTGNDSINNTIELEYRLNGSSIGNCYLSGYAGHGATQGFDFGNTIVDEYIDPGLNTFVIRNKSSSTIQLDHVKIYRTYKMCNTYCVNNEEPHTCQCPVCKDGQTICSGGHSYGTNGSFDDTRTDIPCNSLSCGSLSYTQYHDTIHAGAVIEPSDTLSWTIDFSSYTLGYSLPFVSLLNFNNIYADSYSSGDDVEIALLIGSTTVNNYYLSKHANQPLAPSYDLTQSGSYDDRYGPNTVTLKNLSDVDIVVGSNPYGGIDVYRIYQSTGICEDPCQSGQTDCPETCECCQSTCEIGCQVCNAPCVICYACYSGCEDCQTQCEVSCQECNTSCQLPCELGCQGCMTQCEACEYSCQLPCEACENCYSCQTGCESEYCSPGNY